MVKERYGALRVFAVIHSQQRSSFLVEGAKFAILNATLFPDNGFEAPTVTSVTLNGTIATARVSSRKGFLAEILDTLPDLLRLCPQGKICWKAAAEGPCLANTTVVSAGPHNGSLGQASFDYATVLNPGTPFLAVALYQGSMLCKSAPSDNVKEPPPGGVIVRLPTSMVITAAQSTTATAATSFNITLTIAIPDGRALGGQNVSVSFGDGSLAITVLTSTNGSAAILHAFAATGKYNVLATYAGNGTYSASSATTTLAVGSQATAISLTVTPSMPVTTQPASFEVTLKSAGVGTSTLASKNVTFTYGDGSTDRGTTDTNGTVTFSHTYAASGSQIVVAAFAGDATYSASSASTPLAVDSQATTTSLSVTPSMPVATQPASFAVTLKSTGPGVPALAGKNVTVTYGDGSTDSGTTDFNGAVTFTHTYAASGNPNVVASSAGDGAYSASSAATTLAVGSEATTTSLTVTPTMPVATQPASFAVTLKSAGSGTPALAGKTVTVTYGDGSTDSGTTDTNGAFTFMHTYAASGNQNAVAAFAGDATYSASSAVMTLAIGSEATKTSLTVTPTMPVATQPASFAVMLKSAGPGSPALADKMVTVTYGDGTTDSGTTAANGVATFTHTYAASGNQNVVASFAGDATYSGSSAATTLAIGSGPTTTSLTVTPTMPVATQPASFAVTLKSAGPGSPALADKTVTVTYGDGTTDSGTTAANGVVTFTHTYAASGNQNVVASFAGDATYSGSSAATTLAIGSEAMTTSLTVTPTMPVATQPASFAVMLKSAGPGSPVLADKTVTVTYGDGTTDSGTTAANGVATFTHTYAASGNQNVVASFAGDATYSGSSAATTLAISFEATTLALGFPTMPMVTQPVSFEVTLKSAGPGTPALADKTVTITYGDGSTASDITDVNGMATFTHTYAASGNQNVVASFAGDGTYSASIVSATIFITCGLLPNGDFSAGTSGSNIIPGWTVVSVGSGSYFLSSGGANPGNGFIPDPSHSGQFAVSGQLGGGSAALISSAFVATSAFTLDFFDTSYASPPHSSQDTFNYGVAPNQQSRIDVFDASQGLSMVTGALFAASAEASPYLGTILPLSQIVSGPSDTWTSVSGSLAPYVGRTIYIVVRVAYSSSFYSFGVDNVMVC